MKKISFSMQMVIASLLGLLAGVIFSEQIASIRFLGDIFLRLIQMSMVFLVMGAMIESVGAIEPKDLGKIGVKALVLFLITTIFSAVVGMFVVNIVKPGVGIIGIAPEEFDGRLFDMNITELITEFVPRNIFESMANSNMIQIIVFSIFMGLALSLLEEDESGKRIYGLVVDMNKVIMEIIKMAMKFAPIGVFALMSSITGTIGISVVVPLFKFLFAMFLGTLIILSIHILLVSMYGKINPFRLVLKLKDTIVVSMTTTSSAISLPVQMNDCENKIGISRRISRFVNSLAMSLNSDGLALSISIATIMIAQFYDIDLSLQQQIVIVSISTLTTMGNLLVPGGALVAISIALDMTGLPLAGLALIAGVDWFAGIARTLLNVMDDVLITLVIAVSENEFDRTIFNSENEFDRAVLTRTDEAHTQPGRDKFIQ